MIPLFFSFLLITANDNVFNKINGHLIINLTTYCYDILLNKDGSFLFCTLTSSNGIKIFRNNGLEFETHQSIQLSSRPNQIKGGENDEKIYLLCIDGLKRLEKNDQGLFELHILLSFNLYYSDFFITYDESMIGLAKPGLIEIFKWNGTTYLLNQNFTKINSYQIRLSSDEK